MAAKKPLFPPALFLLLLCFLHFCTSAIVTQAYKKLHPREPCKELVFFFHDVLYQGHNRQNATAAIVGAPDWGNRTAMATPFNFGDLVVFDDPITLDNNFHSNPVGRARGMYFYDMQDTYGSWLSFSFSFNSTEHQGSITFAGADPLMNKTREVSVIGGTGDFFMARGIAVLQTDAFEGDVYFRLKVDIKLYECWK